MKLAAVKWRDAYEINDNIAIMDVPDQTECIKHTIGIVVRDDRNYIGVAHELTLGDKTVSDVTLIPRGMVISVKKYQYNA